MTLNLFSPPNFPIWHPFTQHALRPTLPQVVRAEGAYLYTKDGTRVIDAISSWWVTTHGHCHPRIVAAIKAQAETLDQVIFAEFTHESAERLAPRLIAVAPPGLNHVFFSDSGSTSVEVALKMALGYRRHTHTERERIVVMEHSYHGVRIDRTLTPLYTFLPISTRSVFPDVFLFGASR
jgi:adenosylmethionine---8-amino-7-oxononanoate aminotransferase